MFRTIIVAATALVLLPACSGGSPTGSGNGDAGSGTNDSGHGGGLFGGGRAGGIDASNGGTMGGSPGQCIQTGNQACDACLNASCCDSILACEQNTSCTSLYQCLAACAQNDQSCIDQCISQYGDGKDALEQVLSCADQACTGKC